MICSMLQSKFIRKLKKIERLKFSSYNLYGIKIIKKYFIQEIKKPKRWFLLNVIYHCDLCGKIAIRTVNLKSIISKWNYRENHGVFKY